MAPDALSAIQRRDFLKLVGAITAFSVADGSFAAPSQRIDIVIDAEDPITSSAPVKWAADQLRKALAVRGVPAQIVQSTVAPTSDFAVVVASAESSVAKGFPRADAPLQGAESMRMTSGHWGETSATLVSANDPRGFIYGLLELFGPDHMRLLHAIQPEGSAW